jgi:hypothetical protein
VVVKADSLGLVVVLRAAFDDERERMLLADPSAFTEGPAVFWLDDVLVLASLQYLTGVSETVEWPQPLKI